MGRINFFFDKQEREYFEKLVEPRQQIKKEVCFKCKRKEICRYKLGSKFICDECYSKI